MTGHIYALKVFARNWERIDTAFVEDVIASLLIENGVEVYRGGYYGDRYLVVQKNNRENVHLLYCNTGMPMCPHNDDSSVTVFADCLSGGARFEGNELVQYVTSDRIRRVTQRVHEVQF